MKPIYTVTMTHWCNDKSYIIGAYTKKDQAIKAGEVEQENRGNKYFYRVDEMLLLSKADKDDYQRTKEICRGRNIVKYGEQ